MVNGAEPLVRPQLYGQGEEEYRGPAVTADEGRKDHVGADVTLNVLFFD